MSVEQRSRGQTPIRLRMAWYEGEEVLRVSVTKEGLPSRHFEVKKDQKYLFADLAQEEESP